MAQIEIGFSDRQLNGLYDFMAYRKLIASSADAAKDAAFVKSRKDVVTDDADYGLFLSDAAACIDAWGAEFSRTEVCTADHVQWLAMADAITSANRLATCPGQVFEGVRASRLVEDVATMVDVYGRAADSLARESASIDGPKRMRKRMTPIYVDFLCGRGGAWLEWACDQGRIAAAVAGKDWEEERDAYALLRMGRFAQAVSHERGIEVAKATGFVAVQAMLTAEGFDAMQRGVFTMDNPDGYEMGSFDEPVMYADVAALASAVVPVKSPVGDDLGGYCALFGTSPIDSVVMLPRVYSGQFRKVYADRRASA